MVMLLSHESKVFAQTQTILRRLTMMVINTGLITTISTLLTIIFVAVQPATFTYAFFNILVSGLYANSVMANLNSREYIRGRHNNATATYTTSLEFNTFNSANRPNLPAQHGSEDTKVGGVHVSQDTVIRKDDLVAY